MGKVVQKGAEEARNQLPSLLDEAESGHATLISRRGQAVAALIPMSAYKEGLGSGQQSLLQLEGSGRGLWGRNVGRTVQKLRDEWDR
jgi:prevent-host-death family protein